MNKLRTTIIAALIPAIATLSLVIPPPSNSIPAGCVATVAKAISSPHQVVRGSFDCLSYDEQFAAALGGYNGDEGLQKLAIERGRDHVRYVGSTSDGGRIYELSGAGQSPVTVLF